MKEPRVEAMDSMQYFYSSKHEPLIRCIINFKGHIDEGVLKKAVDLSAKALPIILCRFEITNEKPHWRYAGFTSDDVVKTVKAGRDIESDTEKLAISVIDVFSEPQVKIFILSGEVSDKLIIIINHMVCDGAGFKEYIYLLARLYTGFTQNNSNSEDLISFDRGLSPLLKSFTFQEKIKILSSKTELKKQKNDLVLDFEGDKTNPFIEKRRIAPESFLSIKNYAKKNGVTINDIFLTEYVRIISSETGKDRVILPCPVDLRKYLKGKPFGVSNLTSNYICDITLSPDEEFLTTLKKVSTGMYRQKDSLSCLKPVMLIAPIYNLLSFKKLHSIFDKKFTIPVVSYTNLGLLDNELLRFGNTEIKDAYLTAAVKYVPYFQLTMSSYNGSCTISCNMYGTDKDRNRIRSILESFEKDISENTKE